jgi:hypothetical protein
LKYNTFPSGALLQNGNFLNSDDPKAIDNANRSLKNAMQTSELMASQTTNSLLGIQTSISRALLAPQNKVFALTKQCEAVKTRDACLVLDNPEYSHCGVCIKGGSATSYENADNHIGGMLLLPNDKAEIERKAGIANTPPKYVPSIGSCPEEYFFLKRDQCIKAANREDCKESGQTGGFEGVTLEGNRVATQKCAQVANSPETFIYDPKNRRFNVNLRVLTPSGTGICRIYIYDDKNTPLAYQESSTPGAEFVIPLRNVKEKDSLQVVVVLEAPYRYSEKNNKEFYIVALENGIPTANEAALLCERFGSKQASNSDFQQALKDGATVNNPGWTSDKGFIVPPSMNHPNYTFFQGQDSGGLELVRGPENDIELLEFICDDNTDCVGFTTEGVLKSNIGPKDEWKTWTSDPAKGLYVKNKLIQSNDNPSGTIQPPDTLNSDSKKVGNAWCVGLRPPQSINMTNVAKIQNWNITQSSKYGASDQPKYLRGIAMQWESATSQSKRMLPFEPFLTAVNGIGPENNKFNNMQKFGTLATSDIRSTFSNTNSKMLRNVNWIWSNNSLSQKVQFNAIIPGIFLDSFYPEDMDVSNYGPLVGDPELAKKVIATTA